MNENGGLDETLGLNGPYDLLEPWFTKYKIHGDWKRTKAFGPINWDDNNSTVLSDLTQDINGDGNLTLLEGYNEWDNLILYNGEIGDFGSTYNTNNVAASMDIEETTLEELVNAERFLNVSLSGDEYLLLCPGDSSSIIVKLINKGMVADDYKITYESSSGWYELAGLPTNIHLESSEEVEIPISLNVPDSVAQDERDVLKIIATSSTNQYILAYFQLEISMNCSCIPVVGDFDGDSDVDGGDLVEFIRISSSITLDKFAENFGINICE